MTKQIDLDETDLSYFLADHVFKNKSNQHIWDEAREPNNVERTRRALNILHDRTVKSVRAKIAAGEDTGAARGYEIAVMDRIRGTNNHIADMKNKANMQLEEFRDLSEQLATWLFDENYDLSGFDVVMGKDAVPLLEWLEIRKMGKK
jgi:hypothetical protein